MLDLSPGPGSRSFPGLAGLRERDGALASTPRLPAEISRLAVTHFVRGRRLSVDITPSIATYLLLDGDPMRLMHDGTPLTVTSADPTTRATRATPDHQAGSVEESLGRADGQSLGRSHDDASCCTQQRSRLGEHLPVLTGVHDEDAHIARRGAQFGSVLGGLRPDQVNAEPGQPGADQRPEPW